MQINNVILFFRTLKGQHQEVWYPRLFDRRAHGSWVEADKPTAIKTANDVAREAVSNHIPNSLPAATLDTLKEIIASAE